MFSRTLSLLATLLTSLYLIGPSSVYAHLPQGIAVSIEPTQSRYKASDALMARIQYTNITSSSIRFLKRDTALVGQVSEDYLDISFNGQRLPYIGPHAKRLPPTESEYIDIAPGQTVGGVVDLGFAYPIYDKGEYQVSYRIQDLGFGANAKASGGAVVNVSEDRPVQLLKRPPNIDSSCNATQRAQIDQALGIAEIIAIQARNALNNAPAELRPTARRYTEWFGAFSPQNYATAQLAFNRIASALSTQVIGFDCTCNINNRENVFAFVFSNDPFNMNVCPVFFRTTPSGTDSRAGTIVHEISHFNVVIASDDFQSALDQRGSRALARTSPSLAIRNANAFEYFAENTPFLSMPTAADLPDPADLTVQSAALSNGDLTLEDTSNVTATLVNIGETASASTVISVRLSTDAQITFSDPQIAQGSLPALQPNASFNFSSQINAPSEEGNFFVGVCVSPLSGETSIANNCSAGVPLMVTNQQVIIPPILFLLLSDDEDE